MAVEATGKIRNGAPTVVLSTEMEEAFRGRYKNKL